MTARIGPPVSSHHEPGLFLRFATGLVFLAFPTLAFAQAVVPLEIADGGYLYVRTRIADHVDARLLLDTGAGINTLSPSILKTLGAQAQAAGTHTGTRHNGETVTGPIWSVASVALGEFRKTNVAVGEFAPPGADGLLSMDFFRDQPFTLDLAAGTLTIETADRVKKLALQATSIPIRLKTNGPYELDFFVRICVSGDIEAEAEFDTGAGFNMLMLHPDYMSRLKIAPAGPKAGPLEYYVYSTVLPEVRYCAARNILTSRQFVGFKEGLIYQALIGHGAFRNRQLTIDIPSRRMLAW